MKLKDLITHYVIQGGGYYMTDENWTVFHDAWQDPYLDQGLPRTPKGYQHGDQGGPRERGLGGALHVDYYALCSPKFPPNLAKFGMITNRDKDY